MPPIKVYLDEDVHHLIAHALSLRSRNTLTTVEAGRAGTGDLHRFNLLPRTAT